MNKINYQKELDRLIEKLQKENRVPKLLLHSCCAPCSSYCLEYLSRYFEITIFYYNPNIYPPKEYSARSDEQQRLIREMNFVHPVRFMEGAYAPECFFEMAKGLETVKEGGERCFKCYELRLREAAKEAKAGGYDYFTTTLTISPLKMPKNLTKSDRGSARNTESAICRRISKRKTAISVRLSFQPSIGCIGKTTAAAFIRNGRPRREKEVKNK